MRTRSNLRCLYKTTLAFRPPPDHDLYLSPTPGLSDSAAFVLGSPALTGRGRTRCWSRRRWTPSPARRRGPRSSTLVLGLAAALVRGAGVVGGQGANEGYRIVQPCSGGILLGPGFLVASDIIRTVTVWPAGERRCLGADRADQDVPELLAGGRDQMAVGRKACHGGLVRVVATASPDTSEPGGS